jgi:DNA gyrase/topoisomerase IV subunit A
MIKMNESTIEKDLKINFWRQHIMEGLLKALKMPDEIKKALTKNNAKMVLIEKFGFSPKQTHSLLDLRTYKTSGQCPWLLGYGFQNI